ncbi:hypothetical protein LTS15_010274 [Exophiala xenobiotica]|nr:hypothetical protein LTS15_010274 [Exophiala xenobiotica]
MQSNMITKDLAFAFKRTRPEMPDKKRFRALLCEILALKASAVQDHPNINQIEGIAWDIQEDIVWPVLVFSKANLGSLKHFASGDAWDKLPFEANLRLCIDVALGLHALHISNIVHGDIKPDNILVSQKGTSLVAMVTDFESSCVYGEESDLLTLRKTPPWNAPEWSDRYIRVKDAKLMDVYSFGLVCFWILFRSNLVVDAEDLFRVVKTNDQFPAVTNQILSLWSDLSEYQNSCLSQFFKKTVCLDPNDRESDFEQLLKLMSFDEDFRMQQPDHQAGIQPEAHAKFSIMQDSRSFSVCDYRIRRFLERSLRSTADSQACDECASEVAYQLALGWKTGVFVQSDESLIDQYLQKSGRSKSDFDLEVSEVQNIPNWSARIPRSVLIHGVTYTNDVVEDYRANGVLDEAEQQLRREVETRVTALSHDHSLTRAAKVSLASILRNRYKWKESRDLLTQVLESESKAESGKSSSSTLQSLAAACTDEGQWDQAEAFQLMALEELKEVCGEKHPLMLQALSTLAAIYYGQGRWAEAVEKDRGLVKDFGEVLGSDHLRTLAATEALARTLTKQGSYQEAQKIAEDVVKQSERLTGRYHPVTLQSEQVLAQIRSYMGNADESITDLKRIIEDQKRTLGPLHQDTLSSIEQLVDSHTDNGMWKLALELAQEVVEKRTQVLGPRNLYTLRSMLKLASLNGNLGKYDVAIDLMSHVQQTRTEILGEHHPDTVSAQGVLSSALRATGRLSEAEQLGAKVMEYMQTAFGLEHPDTMQSVMNLAGIYISQGRLREASVRLKSAIDISTKVNGADHPVTLKCLSLYADTMEDAKEAETLRFQILDCERSHSGNLSPSYVVNRNNLATNLLHQGQWEKAEELLTQILPVSREVLGSSHRTTLTILGNMASAQANQGRLKEARESFQELVKIHSETMGENSTPALVNRANLASILLRMGQFKDATAMNEDVLSVMEKSLGESHPETMRLMNNLTAAYAREKRFSDAIRQCERLVELAEKKFGSEHTQTKNYVSTLDTLKS